MPGEFDIILNVSDDNWGDDPDGELQGTGFALKMTLFAKPSISEDSFVDPVLMDPFNLLEEDTATVFLSTYMPSDIRGEVNFAITVNGGSRSFVKLSKNKVQITPQVGDAGSYSVSVDISQAPGSDIGQISMITEFQFTVDALPQEESAEEALANKLKAAQNLALAELEKIEIAENAPKTPPSVAKARQVEFDGSFALLFDQKMFAFSNAEALLPNFLEVHYFTDYP